MNKDMRQELSTTSNGSQDQSNGSTYLQKNGFSHGTKGHSSTTNGSSSPHTNGFSTAAGISKPLNFYGHDREEVTRLLIQGLEDLGYHSAAHKLSHESGFQLESPAVAAFRTAILEGDWQEAESLLFGVGSEPDGGGVSISNGDTGHLPGLKFVSNAEPEMRFMIREQKYLEFLERHETAKALMVLQSELQPLHYDTNKLNALSGLLVSNSSEDLEYRAQWDGARGKSRQRLLTELSKFISPSVMIPQHRLAVLLDQARQGQISRCLYHNPANMGTPSLFSDHTCDDNEFPLRTFVELNESDGEVWAVDFSHNGKSLAACGQSTTVVVYDTATFEVRLRLSEHTAPVVYICWSPDDLKLITCGQDHKAKIWDTRTGRLLKDIDKHNATVTTAAWAPDSQFFVTGTLEKEERGANKEKSGQLYLWSLEDCERSIYNWPTKHRIQDCAISPDGQKLIAVSSEKHICVYNFTTREEEYTINVANKMTCVSISRDSKHMLVNMENDEVHLIEIETADIVRRYIGQQQGGYVIRSSFGGADEGLVVSGSSNSKVYIWHKANGTLIETLDGHTFGCVNAVSWNPANPGMFVSGGDDRKVRIWTREPEPSNFLRRKISSQSTQQRYSHLGRVQ